MKKNMYFILLVTFVSVLAKAQTVIPSYVPTNGLVGWWPFNGNANDESGNGNNGTVNGATLTNDRFGNPNVAYNFNGINNSIIVSDNQTLRPSSISISVWVLSNNLTSDGCVISKTQPGTAQGEQYIIGHDILGKANFQIKRNSNCTPAVNWQYLYTPQNTISNNSWEHIICTYDGVTMKFYNNTVLVSSFNPSAGAIDNCSGGSLNIGRYWQSQYHYNGKLDDIGIWNRALTECEIKKLYHSPSFTVAASTASICAGQSLTLTAGGVPNYSWNNGANTASTIVTPSASTIYTVTSTYTTGCTDTKTVSVNVSACTGFNEVSLENNFTVFPNPAKELITITAGQALIGKTYTINDYTGKVIATGKISSEKTTISMHGLAKGIYIFTSDGKSHKIIKE